MLVCYYLDNDPERTAAFKTAVKAFADLTCIRLVPWTNERNYVKVHHNCNDIDCVQFSSKYGGFQWFGQSPLHKASRTRDNTALTKPSVLGPNCHYSDAAPSGNTQRLKLEHKWL